MPVGKRVLLLVSTDKGGFFLESDERRRDWSVRGPFCGDKVYDMAYDPGTGAILAAGRVWTEDFRSVPAVFRTDDVGESWSHSSEGLTYGEDGPGLKAVWHLAPVHGALYAGVEPAGLFRSEDGGQSWGHIRGLREHPTCPEWMPGNGGLCLHSIVSHPTDPDQMWVAASSVGTFYTADGGRSWEARNTNVRNPFAPEPGGEVGY